MLCAEPACPPTCVQAFFEAGNAWKDAGRLNMAFVMLNRFLDLCDAMDDPDSSAAVIENADFADTDIPFDFHIPQRAYVHEDSREDVSAGEGLCACMYGS